MARNMLYSFIYINFEIYMNFAQYYGYVTLYTEDRA